MVHRCTRFTAILHLDYVRALELGNTVREIILKLKWLTRPVLNPVSRSITTAPHRVGCSWAIAPSAVCRRYPFIHPGEERQRGAKFL